MANGQSPGGCRGSRHGSNRLGGMLSDIPVLVDTTEHIVPHVPECGVAIPKYAVHGESVGGLHDFEHGHSRVVGYAECSAVGSDVVCGDARTHVAHVEPVIGGKHPAG